jgi:ATP-dependent Lhr-like helicase
MYVRQREPSPTGSILDRLRLDLVRSIAIVELLLSGWVEPPEPPSRDLSTLTQQIMSVIGEVGGIKASDIFNALCVRGPFTDIDKSLFARVLRRLGEKKILEQMPEGDLILGSLGENLYRHYSFYSAFEAAETYGVLCGAERLGELDAAPELNQLIVFSGRKWIVLEVDRERKEIQVAPSQGQGQTRFGGKGGMLDDHAAMEMKKVLMTGDTPIYLDDAGKTLLDQCRKTAWEEKIGDKPILATKPGKCCVLTWRGSRINSTILAMFRKMGAKGADAAVGIELQVSPETATRMIREILTANHDPAELALLVLNDLPTGKYDWLLGEDLCAVYHAAQSMRIEEAIQTLREIASKF